MKEVRLFSAPEIPRVLDLPEEEAKHILRVLRYEVGDELWITDGQGRAFRCAIAAASAKRCSVKVLSEESVQPTWHKGIHLAIAPTKNMDRMEWMVEKAVEMGVDSITFLECRNSERRNVKTDRLIKVAISAMKQSHKAVLPVINEMVPFAKFVERCQIEQKFIAHCYNEADLTDEVQKRKEAETAFYALTGNEKPFLFNCIDAHAETIVCIGPEGDFSLDEVRMAEKSGFKPVSLGNNRLRTETAGLSAVEMMYIKKAVL